MVTDKQLPQDRPTGIGIAAYNLALAMSRQDVAVDYVCRGPERGEVRVNDHLTVHTVARFSRDNAPAVLRVVKRTGCRVVHVHSSSALPSVILSKLLGRFVVTHSHDTESLHPLRPALMRQAGVELSDLIIAVSKETKRKVVRTHRVPPDMVEVVYNGVDTGVFRVDNGDQETPIKYGLTNHDGMILSIGAVQGRKGQWRIIESLPVILEKWPRLLYVNVGTIYDTAYRDKLVERARALGVGQAVRFITGIPEEDLVSIINLAALCVHPSVREGFGLAVVEEMACGKPVVAFDTSAVPEIIDSGVDGILVAPGDSLGLTRSILALLDDPELAKRMGEAARKKVESKFTWDVAAIQLKGLYERLLSGR
jgi:glycosyltransferase involved in cell wall biosynthesis